MFQAKVREHRYRVIADRIEQSIADGVYEPGERIASIRQLAESFDASINTMKSALNLLQDRGLIESRPRAGTYVVSRPEVFEGSEYVDDLVDAVIEEYTCRPAAAPTTAKMDHAVLPQALVPADLIKSAMQAAASTQSPLLDGFATFERTAELRSLVSQREMLHGIAINPDQLVLASSIEQTVFQLLVTLNPQRLPVAVQAPTYYGHLTILRALGMPAFELPTMPDGSFSVARLAEAVQRNQVGIALLDTAVHNPTGSCLPESVLVEIAHLVGETQLKVIEYGMLRDMRYTSSASPSLYSLAPSGSVFLCSSYAETLVPSIKAAWVAAGTHATHVRDRWQATSCTVSALQLAILEHMLASGKVRRVQDHNRKLVYESLTAAAELVQDTFPAGSQVAAPSGGFALWIRMPEGVSGRDIFRTARKEGIAIAPGAMFARCQDDYDGWIRVAPGILNHDKEQALRRLATLVADRERHPVHS